MGKSILITGGSGFVGSLIIDAIQAQHADWTITNLDLDKPREPRNGVKYCTGNITSHADVESTIKHSKPDAIIHTAGIVPPLQYRFNRQLEAKVMSVNVDGTKNMLVTTKACGVGAFIYTGSCCAVTDDFRYSYRNIDEAHPMSLQSTIYGESKALAERLVLAANSPDFSTSVLRPSVLFGPGDHQLVPSLHACIAKGETPFVLGDAENLWDVTYAPNVADAHVLAAENLLSSKTAAGEAFFIQNGEPITFRDFCLEVWKNFGHFPPYEFRIPHSVAWLAGLLVETLTWLVGGQYTIGRGSVNDACAVRYASGKKAQQILGFQPKVGIEEGIRLSCEHYKGILKANDRTTKAQVPEHEGVSVQHSFPK